MWVNYVAALGFAVITAIITVFTLGLLAIPVYYALKGMGITHDGE